MHRHVARHGVVDRADLGGAAGRASGSLTSRSLVARYGIDCHGLGVGQPLQQAQHDHLLVRRTSVAVISRQGKAEPETKRMLPLCRPTLVTVPARGTAWT